MRSRGALPLPVVLSAWLGVGCGTSWSVVDIDGDGFSPAQGDCWDAVEGPEGSGLKGADIHPGAGEAWYDGVDQDCGGDDDFDADGDGWVVEEEHLGVQTLGVPASGRHTGAGDCWDAPLDGDHTDHAPLDGGQALGPEQVHPGADGDRFYDGVDQDCAGDDDFDADGDGHASTDHPQRDGSVGTDCDDADPDVNPDVPLELCNDIDDDCDGLIDSEDDDIDAATMRVWSLDADGDGYGDPATELESCSRVEDHILGAGEDCDDTNADVSPGATEVCNGADDDCDALVDDQDDDVDHSEGAVEAWADVDGDGYGDPDAGDTYCDVPEWAVDNTLDCNDADPDIRPGVTEVCDGQDNDCNGLVDDEDPGVDGDTIRAYFRDDDGDGYGSDTAPTVIACSVPSGFAVSAGDCEDGDASINPGAAELPGDEVDQDCDDAEVCYADADRDGFAESSGSTVASADTDCSDAGEADDGVPRTDCDDGDAAISPDADEVCDPDDVDEDCDGVADDADGSVDASTMSTFYDDGDGDGFGDPDGAASACDAPSGTVTNDEDCDDGDAAISPDATEVCDAADVDEDCSGSADDADAGVDASTRTTFYDDDDGDGYGDPSTGVEACDAPSGTVTNDGDCDDGDGDISPDATEVCDPDDVDEDCSGAADDDDSGVDASTYTDFYEDGDGDGHGLASSVLSACDLPPGYAELDDDCDDGDEYVSPSATEVCNDGLDNDCDAATVCELTDGTIEDAPLGVLGSSADVFLGASVQVVDDIDGDGLPDALLGAPTQVDLLGDDQGAVYVVTGWDALADPSAVGDTVSTSSTSAAVVELEGITDQSRLGQGLAAGDVDGDGFVDLWVGAPESSSWAGAAWLVSGPIDGSTTLASDGEVVTSAHEQFGYKTLVADLDNDGLLDLIASSPESALTGDADSGNGVVTVLLGSAMASATSLSTTSVLTFDGAANKDAFGFDVAAGDVNGDGSDDLWIGSPKSDVSGANDSGRAYLIAGPATAGGSVTGGSVTGKASALGAAAADQLGYSVAAGVDVDGDGYGDLLVGTPKGDPGGVGNDSGGAWLILGSASVAAAAADSLTADTSIESATSGVRVGEAVGFAGDVDDDGSEDIVLGVPRDDTAAGDAGAVHIVHGPFASGSLSLSSASVVTYTGVAGGDHLGTSVAAGDLDGDGYSDILVGSPEDSVGDTDAGAVYLLMGLGL